MVATVADEYVVVPEAEAAGLPLDVEVIAKSVHTTLGMSLNTTRREEIDSQTALLTGHLALLSGQCLGEDRDPDVAHVLGLVARHLSLDKRPSRRTHAHDAFNYMHDCAVFTRALLSAFERQQKDGS